LAARTDAARRAILKGQAPPDIPPKLEKPNIELNALLLEAFVKQYLMDRFDGGVPTPQLHREMWEDCCSTHKYVAEAAPRGHAKSSSITLAYVLAVALFRQRDFIVIVSDTWGQAVEFLRDIKTELLENEQIIKDFETRKALKDSEDDIIFQMRDGHKFRIVARGSEQKVRGLKWNHRRPNLIVIDDAEGDEQVESKNRRDKFFKWLMKALLPCGSDDCLFRWVGTILHFDSALERIMKDSTWKTRRYSAHKGFDDFSEILWPEKFNERRLRDIREKYVIQGESDGYSCEYLNQPIAEGDAYFRRENLLEMSDVERKMIREGKLPVVYYAGWDFAVTKDQKSDYTVCSIWGVASNNKKYKVDCRRGRFDSKEIVDEMLSVQQAYAPACHFVEGGTINNSLGPFLFSEMASKGKYLNLVKLNSTKDKITRGRTLQAITKARDLIFDKEISEWPEMEEEYTRFPKGQHDDIVDSDIILALGLQDIIPALTDEEIEDEEYAREFGQNVETGRSSVTGY
jgi:predicted phage terminase large subunit-like protein